MSAGMAIKGDKELIRSLDQLGSRVKKKVARAAAMKAATPIMKAMRRNMPRDTGTMRKAVGRRVKTYGREGNVVVAIGVRWGKSATVYGRKINPYKIIHLIEEGFTHVTGLKGSRKRQVETGRKITRSKVAGTHPIRRAWGANLAKSARIIKDKAWQGIQAEARKARK